jgi:hypothetical protein
MLYLSGLNECVFEDITEVISKKTISFPKCYLIDSNLTHCVVGVEEIYENSMEKLQNLIIHLTQLRYSPKHAIEVKELNIVKAIEKIHLEYSLGQECGNLKKIKL